jgi:hypothetical protein
MEATLEIPLRATEFQLATRKCLLLLVGIVERVSPADGLRVEQNLRHGAARFEDEWGASDQGADRLGDGPELFA